MRTTQRLAMAHAELLVTIAEVNKQFNQLKTTHPEQGEDMGELCADVLLGASRALRELLDQFSAP